MEIKNNSVVSLIKKRADDILECDNTEDVRNILNSITDYLILLGLNRDHVIEIYQRINDLNQKDKVYKEVLFLADFLGTFDLPSYNPANIQVNNSNAVHNSILIDIINKSIENELTTDQIKELKKLIKNNNGGDLKAFLKKLGLDTAVNLLSQIILKVCPF